MSDEINLEHLAKLFDAALASDNPSVKKALRNFMLVASIVESEGPADKPVSGPMTGVLQKVDRLEKSVEELTIAIQRLQANSRNTRDYYYDQYTATKPAWYGYDQPLTTGTTTDTVDFLDLYRKYGSSKGKI